MKNIHSMPFGATVLPDDAGVRFHLWAPGVQRIELDLEGRDGPSGPDPEPRLMERDAEVDDLEAALQQVEQAGGRLVRPIFAFPGGRRFHFREPGGTEMAVYVDRS